MQDKPVSNWSFFSENTEITPFREQITSFQRTGITPFQRTRDNCPENRIRPPFQNTNSNREKRYMCAYIQISPVSFFLYFSFFEFSSTLGGTKQNLYGCGGFPENVVQNVNVILPQRSVVPGT
jgi:hypothetical protein